MRLLLVHSFLLLFAIVHAAIADYGSASDASATSNDDVLLMPSPLRNPHPPTPLDTQLESGAVPASDDPFSSDGRPVGVVDVQTAVCDPIPNGCNVKVTTPGRTSEQSITEPDQTSTIMFPTTATAAPAVVDSAALAASNEIKVIHDVLAGATQDSEMTSPFGFAHALPGIGVLVAVCAFLGLETLLSYAITGNSLLSSVLDLTKNPR